MAATPTTKSYLPITRINTIMKSCSDAEMVSREATLLMCRAAELFIKTLAVEAFKKANKKSPIKRLEYKDLAEIVHNEEKYDFLVEMMPKKITVLEFKKILAKKQRQEKGQPSDSSEEESEENEEEDEEENSTNADEDDENENNSKSNSEEESN